MADRTRNSKHNIYTAIISDVITVLCSFISKTLVIHRFGIEYTGINDLFSSILGVLSFSELGFSTAIIVFMYKPLADNDVLQVNALLAFYRKVYHIIGTVILCIGLIIMPFLPYLIDGRLDADVNMYILYLIYLINSVSGYYMFVYRSSLLEAAQKQNIARYASMVGLIIATMIKVIVSVFTTNFYLFCAAMIVGTVVTNFLSAYFSKKYFPQYKCAGMVVGDVRRDIFKKVKGLALINIDNYSRNTFDSIVISIYIGLKAVGQYGLYYYIYFAVFTGLGVIASAIQASVGNSIVTESVEKNYHDMLRFQFIFSGLSMWAFNCMLVCYQPFMKIWAGEENLLPMTDVILFCIYFYIMSLTSIRNLYVNGKGLWWSLKYITIAEAAGNLILNFVLGKFFGIAGVLLASIITMLIFNYLMINRKLFKEYFGKGDGRYYTLVANATLVTIGTALISYGISTLTSFEGLASFLVNLLIATAVSVCGFWIVFRRSEEFKESIGLVRRMLPHMQ